MIIGSMQTREWWKKSVFYQIFPASFYDSNGDGVGDLSGITMKLEYLSWLGVDAIWLSPIFESPLHDMGYDVTDFKEIHPVFGKLSDFKDLLYEAHRRGIRIILDLVLNHTSIKHPWFKESRLSRDNPKRDWYIWQEGRRGGKPNNWKSLYGGSAWSYDLTTDQYYYHSFFKEQPDLNWRNPQVRMRLYSIMQFWLDLGIDGFRLDAINVIVKNGRFIDSQPALLRQLLGRENYVTRNQAESYDFIQEMREVTDRYGDILLLGEIYALPPGNPGLIGTYLAMERKLLHLAFDFSLIFAPFSARKFLKAIRASADKIPGGAWPCNVLSNHDLNRSIERIWLKSHSERRAKVLATLLLTLRGTPFIYYGEEIALRNSRIRKMETSDPLGKKFWPFYPGRDPARSPMPWNNNRNAGFSTGIPWLPLHKDKYNRNVLVQMLDNQSVLNYYRQLLSLRRSSNALQNGEWRPVNNGGNNILAYQRSTPDEEILIVLNFSKVRRTLHTILDMNGTVLLSTDRNLNRIVDLRRISLSPFESTVIRIDQRTGR